MNFFKKKSIIIVSNGASHKHSLNSVLISKDNSSMFFKNDCCNGALYKKKSVSTFEFKDNEQFRYKKNYLN